jgi:hypothetical protein
MADYAATNAETGNIRNFSGGMAANQRREMNDLNAIRRDRGLELVPRQFSPSQPPAE